jgi:tRNA(Ile)-lysidine synthase
MSLTANDLLERLQVLTAGYSPSRWVVAFSGGVDSTVLLHALANSNTDIPLLAVHIDHGLHPDSVSWASHCAAAARQLNTDFLSREIYVAANDENGPEAAARHARYAAFLSILEDRNCLLSGHHENDQAETLLLNLMRGSGPAGLAGIGARQSFGRGLLLRPLLGVPGSAIREYARQHHLSWIEDPSNIDTRFDRNFLRKEIVPRLAARWPAVNNRLRRSAELVSEASELLNELADIDIAACGSRHRLDIGSLSTLSQARQRNLLRRAIRLCGLAPAPATRLYQVANELIPSREDAQPLVTWSGAEIRRYRGQLYIMSGQKPASELPAGGLWRSGEALALGPGYGSLRLTNQGSRGIDPDLIGDGLTVRFRHGGEEIRIVANGATRKLKKLLQEAGILPWMRDRLPLIFAGDTLIAVADLWVSADHAVENGLSVEWVDKPALH